ncbi:MAG TPA: 2-oxoacid:acceptor oxidoreductase family protein [bacterium]|nr:2-oxoacid:acceptor oxidoreductase family protein [bacterium]HPN31003.1 2-oxoacid:acceptor oxidoreductase family protein [bacterium]
MNLKQNVIEIIWFGRGGQGVVTASQLAGAAAYKSGYSGINATPMFGAERRGAPVESYLKLSEYKINIYSNIEQCDYLVILDDTLIEKINPKIIKNNKTILIINTDKKNALDYLSKNLKFKSIAYSDAYGIAKSLELAVSGNIIVNTPILGAVIKGSSEKLYTLDSLKKTLFEKFSQKPASLNFQAAEEAYNKTEVINFD